MFSYPMLKEDSLISVMAQQPNLGGQGTPLPGGVGQIPGLGTPQPAGLYNTGIPGLGTVPPVPTIPQIPGFQPFILQPVGVFLELMPTGDYGSENYHKRIYSGYNREYGNYTPYTWTNFVKAVGGNKDTWVVKEYPGKDTVQRLEKAYQDKVTQEALQKAMTLTQGFQIPALPGAPPLPTLPTLPTFPTFPTGPVLPVNPMAPGGPIPQFNQTLPPPGAIPANFTIAPINPGVIETPKGFGGTGYIGPTGLLTIDGTGGPGGMGGIGTKPVGGMGGPIGVTAGLAVVNVATQKKKTRTGPTVGSFVQVEVTQLKPRLSDEPYQVVKQGNIDIPVNIQTQIQPRPEMRPVTNPNIVPIAAYTPGQNIIEILTSIDQSKLSTKRSVKGKTYTVEELRDFVSRMGLLVGTPNKVELINIIKGKLLENKLLAE